MSEQKPEEKKARKSPVRHQVDELEAMRKCDKVVSELSEEEAKRVVKWLFDRHNGAGYLAPSSLQELAADTFGQ